MRKGELATAVAAAVAGASLAAVALAGGTLVLYTGEGLLSAAGFLLGLALISAAAGAWVGQRDGQRRTTGPRWTGAVVAFAAAAIYAEVWIIARDFRTTTPGMLFTVVFLIAEPAYVVGALLGTLQVQSARRDGRGLPPALMGLVGAALGAVLAALVLIPRVRLGSGLLLLAFAVAGAGHIERRAARSRRRTDMRGKSVLITGVGGRGQVGFMLAEAFLARGARVAIVDVRAEVEQHARELAGEGEVVGVRADLTTEAGADEAVRTAVERFGGLDVLVNAAGGLSITGSVTETAPDGWERELARNATTAFLVTRAALPHLREGGGAIVNFASPAALRAPGGLTAYAAAKAAVVALTRATAVEERGRVRANAVAPGMIDTEQNRAAVADAASVPWITRDQLAQVVLFLAGDESAAITGETVSLHGAGIE